MPGPVTLAELTTQVRRRADMENTQFVTDVEIQAYLEGSLGELWDIVLEEGGGDHYVMTTPTDSTAAGTQDYILYSNLTSQVVAPVYRVLGVEALFSGKWRRLRRFSFWETAKAEDISGWSDESMVQYRVYFPGVGGSTDSTRAGAVVRFIPTPQAVHSFRVRYVQYPPDWSDGDFAAFQSYSGWDEFIVCDAAAKCLEKEESSAQHLYMRKAAALDRIRHASRSMNHGEGHQMRDVYEDYVAYGRLPPTA